MAIIKASSHRSTNKRVFEIITEAGILDKRILDIGAGKGYMAQLLGNHVRDKGGQPAEVITACDLFPEYFAYEEIPCRKMDFANELPFADASFDIVYAVEVIEHLRNPYDFIQEIFRVVRPGGHGRHHHPQHPEPLLPLLLPADRLLRALPPALHRPRGREKAVGPYHAAQRVLPESCHEDPRLPEDRAFHRPDQEILPVFVPAAPAGDEAVILSCMLRGSRGRGRRSFGTTKRSSRP
ncbi:MAG: class I SAM-dependent methyltransferase [Desulfobacterales bacterium]|nr:class I SAM-dependent methyltransferase [Desulfobacterales bacterium]